MSFREFTFPGVGEKLGLRIHDGRVLPNLAPVAVRSDFEESVTFGAELAQMASTEKSRSEFIIAPVLIELRRSTGHQFNLFSGFEFDVDREQGLNGVCDFLLTHGPSQHFVSYPVAAVVEAKNYEFTSGFGQCISAMRAAVIANERAQFSAPIFGVVTYGLAWKFLRIHDREVIIDTAHYDLKELPLLMAALEYITRRPVAAAA